MVRVCQAVEVPQGALGWRDSRGRLVVLGTRDPRDPQASVVLLDGRETSAPLDSQVSWATPAPPARTVSPARPVSLAPPPWRTAS